MMLLKPFPPPAADAAAAAAEAAAFIQMLQHSSPMWQMMSLSLQS